MSTSALNIAALGPSRWPQAVECACPSILNPRHAAHLRLYASSATARRRFSSPARAREGQRGGGGGLLRAALLGIFGAGTYLLGSLYPPSYISLLYPAPAPPKLDKDSEAGIAHCAEIERRLLTLAAVQKLKASASPATTNSPLQSSTDQASSAAPVQLASGSNPVTEPPMESANPNNTAHYIMSRPYARFPASKALHSLTAGSLRGPGLFATAPLVMSLTPHGAGALGGHEGDAYAFLHLGRSMCGHDGLIHGGLLATVLDETLARTAFFSLPHHVGVTARLEVDYRAPVKADQFVVVRTEKVESKGRKCTVQGSIQSLDGQILVQAKAIFVEPRMAKFLDNSLVKQAMDTDGEAAKAPLITPVVVEKA
ncbi:Uncharacterized conserved protein [Ceraceosorus bombacis]|uniref:Uncharacterized conserved protein n=1 Tax=Ceraceosorus bombacis TaxID=401625 RepID=A0A0P1BGQ8_9BASI|nr:Uncharacterized conserved protein [Ceraceosorus bombacis]